MQAQILVVAGFTYAAEVFNNAARPETQCTRAQEQRAAGLISNCLGACGEKKATNLVQRPFQSTKAQEMRFEETVKLDSFVGEVLLPRELFDTLWTRIASRPSWTYPAGL